MDSSSRAALLLDPPVAAFALAPASWYFIGSLQELACGPLAFDLPGGNRFNTVFTATIAKRGDRWLVRGFPTSVNAFDHPLLGLAIKKTARRAGLGALAVGLLIGLLLARMFRRKATVVSATS